MVAGDCEDTAVTAEKPASFERFEAVAAPAVISGWLKDYEKVFEARRLRLPIICGVLAVLWLLTPIVYAIWSAATFDPDTYEPPEGRSGWTIAGGVIGWTTVLFGLGLAPVYVIGNKFSPRYGEVVKLLKPLSRDLAEGTAMDIFLDGTSPTSRSKLCPSEGEEDKVQYADEWLRLSFKTTEGNRVRITVGTKTRLKYAGNSSVPRFFRKQKYRTQSRFRLRITASPRRYRGWRPGLTDIAGTEYAGVDVERVTVEGEECQVWASCQTDMDSHEHVLQLLAAIYGHLIPIQETG